MKEDKSRKRERQVEQDVEPSAKKERLEVKSLDKKRATKEDGSLVKDLDKVSELNSEADASKEKRSKESVLRRVFQLY